MFQRSAFLDELCKIAASKDRFSVAQSRAGRRSMSVDTLLRKEKDGTLYASKVADAVGIEVVDGKKRVLSDEEARQQLSGLPDGILRSLKYLLGDLGDNHTDLIPGGKADARTPEEFDQGALAKGQKVEYEHTDDPRVAQEIAMDHLVESPEYYDALEKMEKSLEDKSAAAKHADSWKPQWLELSYTAGERGMQNVPVKGKRQPGDAPGASDEFGEGQRPASATYAQPTNSAIAPKVAGVGSLHEKIAAATIGRLVRSPTDTSPDVDGPQNRIKHELEHLYYVQSAPDAQPLTGTASDAYQRT